MNVYIWQSLKDIQVVNHVHNTRLTRNEGATTKNQPTPTEVGWFSFVVCAALRKLFEMLLESRMMIDDFFQFTPTLTKMRFCALTTKRILLFFLLDSTCVLK